MHTLDAHALSTQKVKAKLTHDGDSKETVFTLAREIIAHVAKEGDRALAEYSERFDGVRPAQLILHSSEMEAALARLPVPLHDAMAFAAQQIEAFHRGQLPVGYKSSIGPRGSTAEQRPRPLDRVGVYVPGGPKGYPSTVLMGVIPARLAEVPEILVATPPAKESGAPPDIVLAAAFLAGAKEVLVAGGAQAIAAMAYGTPSVRPVDKIVGPGNAYVTAAKLLVQDLVGTDGIAGPSEVLVVADDSLPTAALAAELLAQGEHDRDAVSIAILVGDRPFDEVLKTIHQRSRGLYRGKQILETLRRNGWLVRVPSVERAIEIANALATEHLVLAVHEARSFLDSIRNAGCVFVGPWSAVPMGDYTAGTNHVLPTASSARWSGGLSVRDFVKFVSYVDVTSSDVDFLAGPAITLARAEGFEAHAAALECRVLWQGKIPS